MESADLYIFKTKRNYLPLFLVCLVNFCLCIIIDIKEDRILFEQLFPYLLLTILILALILINYLTSIQLIGYKDGLLFKRNRFLKSNFYKWNDLESVEFNNKKTKSIETIDSNNKTKCIWISNLSKKEFFRVSEIIASKGVKVRYKGL